MRKSLLVLVCCLVIGVKISAQLQVNLLYLEANSTASCNIKVDWATDSETDMGYFIVLRAEYPNGVSFTPIDTVSAIGNSTNLVYYSSIDSSFISDSCYYYRLQVVSNNEQSLLTDIVAACRCNFTAIKDIPGTPETSLSPNPATNQLTINSSVAIKQVNIYNTTGQLLKTVYESSQIDISSLAKGVYMAEVKTKQASVMLRWVKM